MAPPPYIDRAFADYDDQLSRAYPDAPASYHNWRWRTANLPPDEWRRWRRLSESIIASLNRPTADDIVAAEQAAAEILSLIGAPTS